MRGSDVDVTRGYINPKVKKRKTPHTEKRAVTRKTNGPNKKDNKRKEKGCSTRNENKI